MKQLFRALSRTSDGAFVVNQQHKIVFWNQAAQSILGFRDDEVLNRQCHRVLGGLDDQGQVICQHFCYLYTGAFQGNNMPNMDAFVLTKEGNRRWINLSTFTFQISNEPARYVLVHLFRDATQKKKNERFVKKIAKVTSGLREEKGNHHIKADEEILPESDYEILTSREREVLHLLARGLGTEEMADRLSISPATTRNHIQNTFGKLRVHSRLEAVAYAYQQGLIGLN